MKEIWKPVIGYEGYYDVSNIGRVKSLKRKHVTSDKILKIRFEKHGYPITHLRRENYFKTYLVHRLVASAFIENTSNKKEVNHINAIKDDNRVDNLEWCTRLENVRHAYKLNLVPVIHGERQGSAYLKGKDVLLIRDSKLNLRETAEKYGTKKSTVWNIQNGVTWSRITGIQYHETN